ncbi:hypothetical protein roselon_03424 [Roseibacterium elongatum DSM 19469]|uniref:Uncharacterized protein n=1 Tax=Roseicyclus elongatus DSM 19469 TaxID=1294273 RepID=W8S611_9RHOB|nr:hypothetical protein [Roseibacterium elongatum]AHM05682.1 hypothetical protein roselon_03424 [Roseibacterium elongatum DSM 19469]
MPLPLLRASLCAVFLAGPVTAQNMSVPPTAPDGFETAMEAALAEAGTGAQLVRCTALFRAFRLYAGDETDLGRMAAERETDMAVFSVMVWQDDTGSDDMDAAFATVVPWVTEATELYLDRMVDNQAALGTVFDPDLEANLGFCNALRDRLTGDAPAADADQ